MIRPTFVFDLDGVIYRGDQPLPGAVETLRTLRTLDHQVYFFTNNSTVTRSTYAEKLQSMEIAADESIIMTSAYATALYLAEHGNPGDTAYIVGEVGPRVELSAVGIRIAESGLNGRVDYVVVGLDRNFDYKTLTHAQQAILRGAKFIAMNMDPTFPLEEGRIVPGGGSIVRAIEAASGVTPTVIGKPETYSMCKVLEMAGAVPDDVVVVGDRLDTDILAGKRIGAYSVLVLTGVTTETDLETAPPELKPDAVIRALPEILDILDER